MLKSLRCRVPIVRLTTRSIIHFNKNIKVGYTSKDDNRDEMFKLYQQSLAVQDVYTKSKLEPITEEDIGKEVVLSGSVQSIRKLSDTLQFINIRRNNCITQCIVDDKSGTKVVESMKGLKLESIVCVSGRVRSQSSKGKLEVQLSQLHVLNPATYQPFLPSNFSSDLANEEVRLKNRFIDLRRQALAQNLQTRGKVNQLIRNYLIENRFLEVETPLLFKATPEGAREFLVPTRRKGYFYSLPQSPQQFKQLLMASGVDRYFQIVKCFRDEDLRKDRQPEFTQLDLELAYADELVIKQVIEGLIQLLWKEVLNVQVALDTLPTLTYKEVMQKYGSDKPDLRSPFEIVSLNSSLEEVAGLKLPEDVQLQCLVLDHPEIQLSNSQLKKVLHEVNQGTSSTDVIGIHYRQSKPFVLKPPQLQLSDEEWVEVNTKLANFLNLSPTCTIFSNFYRLPFTGGSTPMGKLLSKLTSLITVPTDAYRFLWVVDFPLMEPVEKEANLNYSTYQPVHHPFTAPHTEDIHLLHTNPAQCRARHYDLVLNGMEIGGGSIRIHHPQLQQYLFDAIKMDKLGQHQFQHLLNALASGCPPHGGIALGLDRLLTVLTDSTSLKEVIAFPKTNLGSDLTFNSPALMSNSQLEIYGLKK